MSISSNATSRAGGLGPLEWWQVVLGMPVQLWSPNDTIKTALAISWVCEFDEQLARCASAATLPPQTNSPNGTNMAAPLRANGAAASLSTSPPVEATATSTIAVADANAERNISTATDNATVVASTRGAIDAGVPRPRPRSRRANRLLTNVSNKNVPGVWQGHALHPYFRARTGSCSRVSGKENLLLSTTRPKPKVALEPASSTVRRDPLVPTQGRQLGASRRRGHLESNSPERWAELGGVQRVSSVATRWGVTMCDAAGLIKSFEMAQSHPAPTI